MRATNGSDTSSSSEGGKRKKKKEQVEWKWNGIGSQFSEESSSKRVKVRTIREVIIHQDVDGSVSYQVMLV